MSKLTDNKIKAITQKGKHFDGGGLYIYVLASGNKSWRIDYRFQGKYKTMTLGIYPAVSLSEARKALDELKSNLQNNIDPQFIKKGEAQAGQELFENTFEHIALDWIRIKQSDKSEKHRRDIHSKLERFIYPTLRNKQIDTITVPEILEPLRRIDALGLYETRKKTLSICNQIFSFAIGEGKVERNICFDLSKQLVPAPSQTFPFITDRKLFGKLLNDIDKYPNNRVLQYALQLAPLVFLRPGELINATWNEIDFEEKLWTISEERMKTGKKHLVPLSTQVIELLQGLHKITGTQDYLFANYNKGNKPFTLDGLRKTLVILGYPKDVITTHGFRHTASTMLNELGYNADHIEKQLAHSDKNTVRATYNHAEYLPERRKMMQEWADFCDKLKEDKKNKHNYVT